MSESFLRPWFAQPLALALIAVLPALGLLALLARRRRCQALARLGSWPALQALTFIGPRWRTLRAGCRVLGLVLLIVGIAGPRWGQDRDPATAPGRDVVVVLDMSRSMLAQDVLGQSSPNRFGRARDALRDLAEDVQWHGGHHLALVVFAARARVVCPLTHDYDHFRSTLAHLDPSDPLPEIEPGSEGSPSGTRIGEGIRLAVQAQDPRFRGHQDVLLLSDGDDPARDGEWRVGVTAAQGAGIPVHTVGVGNPDTASPVPLPAGGFLKHQGRPVETRLEEKPLEEIARQTKGTYVPARTRALPLGELFRERIEPLAGHEDADDVLPVYRQRYPWFLGIALGLLALEVTLGDGRRKRPGPGASKAQAVLEETGS